MKIVSITDNVQPRADSEPTGHQIEVAGNIWEYWYDRYDRMWAFYKTDGLGNQVGDTRYAPTKELALVNIGLYAYG